MRHFTLLVVLFFVYSLSAQTIEFIEQSAENQPPLNFSNPVDVTGAGDGNGRLFIVERAGRIKVFDQTTKTVLPGDFLDISSRVRSGGERGLLGLAFHPNYANNGYFYVNYTGNSSAGVASGTSIIARFTNNDPASVGADAGSELRIMTVSQFAGNHNAGDLAFGPDGYLYIPFGDGGGGGDPQDNGQKPLERLGKLLRIDVDNPSGGNNYGIPADNPFAGSTDTLPEIWALGLRNPWRISFDRETGDLWIADVGQNAREEINFQPAGSAGGLNYGWDCREGFIRYNGSRSARCITGELYEQPIFDYPHDPSLNGSVTGGFVYRGQHADDLVGKYVFAEYASNEIFQLGDPTQMPIESSRTDITGFNSVSTFGEDDQGNLFVMSLGGGLFEVTTSLALPVELASWSVTRGAKSVRLAWETTAEIDAASFTLERSADGETFELLQSVAAKAAPNAGSTYEFTDDQPLAGTSFYRLSQVDLDGSTTRYAVKSVRFLQDANDLVEVSPNPNDGRFRVLLSEEPEAIVTINVFSPDGRLLLTQTVNEGVASPINLDLRRQASGIYQVETIIDGSRQVESVVIK